MPFVTRNLSVLAFANAATLWHYRTHEDTLATVSTPNYFAGMARIKEGDLIMVVAADSASILVVVLDDAFGAVVTGPLKL